MPRAPRNQASRSATPDADADDDEHDGSPGDARRTAGSEPDSTEANREPGIPREVKHDRLSELADIAAEESDDLLHMAAEVRAELARADGPATGRPASHAAVQLPGASRLLAAIQRGDWQSSVGPHGTGAHGTGTHGTGTHGGGTHGTGTHGTGTHGGGQYPVEPHVPVVLDGIGIVMPVLVALISGWAEANLRASRERQTKWWVAGLDKAHRLSQAPTTVDPAVSFAPGGCCLIEIGPDGAVTILPGGLRRSFRRAHRKRLLYSAFAQRWAQLLSLRPDVQLSRVQAAELTAWSDLPRDKDLRRAPAIAIVAAPAARPSPTS
jgi:hypothetical protein